MVEVDENAADPVQFLSEESEMSTSDGLPPTSVRKATSELKPSSDIIKEG